MSSEPRTRAGRLRLVARRALAQRASELLNSKEEALERERSRLEGYARRAEEAWRTRWARASDTAVRARMLGAADDLQGELRGNVATVEPHWQVSMGITYPGGVDVVAGDPPTLTSTAALGPAIDSSRAALSAAAEHAAAATAVSRVRAELTATRHRRRAIEDRLLPTLDRELHELDLHLDELDREEATRVSMRVDGRGRGWR